MDEGVEVLGRHLQKYDLPWVVFTPLPDSWKLILGMRGGDVLVFDPTKHEAPVQFTPEDFGSVAVWRPLAECVAEWADDVTPAQAIMLLPHTLPPFPDGQQLCLSHDILTRHHVMSDCCSGCRRCA
jgi:hypothetical protein